MGLIQFAAAALRYASAYLQSICWQLSTVCAFASVQLQSNGCTNFAILIWYTHTDTRANLCDPIRFSAEYRIDRITQRVGQMRLIVPSTRASLCAIHGRILSVSSRPASSPRLHQFACGNLVNLKTKKQKNIKNGVSQNKRVRTSRLDEKLSLPFTAGEKVHTQTS